jgi:hypothetical protein
MLSAKRGSKRYGPYSSTLSSRPEAVPTMRDRNVPRTDNGEVRAATGDMAILLPELSGCCRRRYWSRWTHVIRNKFRRAW